MGVLKGLLAMGSRTVGWISVYFTTPPVSRLYSAEW
jgi:hypothetical protein